MARLNTFRRNRELCDIVLLVDKREIFAHKAVLAAVSPTLFEILAHPSIGVGQRDDSPVSFGGRPAANGIAKNAEAQDGHAQQAATVSTPSDSIGSPSYLEFNDVDYDCFDALITYAYTGR